MGRLSIGEETNVPATPTAGNTLFSTVATPSLFRLVDDAGGVYTVALLGKAQTFTGAQTFGSAAPIIFTRSDLTIASDAITITGNFHRIDTEAAGATDNLATINGGADGQILILSSVSSARDTTVKNGTGNITLAGSDFVLDNTADMLVLILIGSTWRELSRSNNA